MPRSAAQRAAQRATLGPTEKVFQAQVLQYARLMGWLPYHTFLSVRSAAGFPDCVLLRGERLVVAELKGLTGRLTAAQVAWLDAWRQIPCAEVAVWRPTDHDWADIERTLR